MEGKNRAVLLKYVFQTLDEEKKAAETAAETVSR